MGLIIAVPMLLNVHFGRGNMQSPVITVVILVGIILQILQEAKMLLLLKDYRTLTESEKRIK